MSEFVGQWIGDAQGNSAGTVLADFDPIDGKSNGTVYLFPTDPTPSVAADIQIPEGASQHESEVEPLFFFAGEARPISNVELQRAFPEISFPKKVKISLKLESRDTAVFNWTSDVDLPPGSSLSLM